MEIIRFHCEEKSGIACGYCSSNGWVGPPMGRIPRPIPDIDKLPEHHYKSVFTTSSHDDDGTLRQVDDYQPRVNLKKAFNSETVSLNDKPSI